MKRFLTILLLLTVLCTSCSQPVLNSAPRRELLLPESISDSASEDEPLTIDDETTEKLNSSSAVEAEPTPTATPAPSKSGKVKVHYIDVGQGDSIFIELTGNRCMLIDSGERAYGSKVVKYVKKLGYKKIDFLVVTHAHSDHMGSMSEVIDNLRIGKIYMPKAGNNTVAYEKMLKSIEKKNLKIKIAKAGVHILKEDNLSIDIIAPTKDFSNLNDTSAVIMLKFGKNKFLFMGDAEKDSENSISASVKCDVVKVGHHGSNTSSTASFVAKTHAKYAVVSVGKGNDYGHPKQQTINRWTKAGAKILRTDELGTIVITSSGKKLTVKTEKKASDSTPAPTQAPSGTAFVLNTNTKKIHRKNCEHVKEIKPWNYKETTKSVYYWIEQGYTPCNTCKPDQ